MTYWARYRSLSCHCATGSAIKLDGPASPVPTPTGICRHVQQFPGPHPGSRGARPDETGLRIFYTSLSRVRSGSDIRILRCPGERGVPTPNMVYRILLTEDGEDAMSLVAE